MAIVMIASTPIASRIFERRLDLCVCLSGANREDLSYAWPQYKVSVAAEPEISLNLA